MRERVREGNSMNIQRERVGSKRGKEGEGERGQKGERDRKKGQR